MRREETDRQPAATPAAESLETELARIRGLGVDQLRPLWRSMTRQSAPSVLSRDLLARMIVYRIQEQRLGKLGRETRKLLDRLARDKPEPVRHLKIGTVVMREYKGVLHEVMVVPGGFSWQEKTYASLSTVAHAITGTSWNGPRFFGLRGRNSPNAPESAPMAKARPRAAIRGSVRAHRQGQPSTEGRP